MAEFLPRARRRVARIAAPFFVMAILAAIASPTTPAFVLHHGVASTGAAAAPASSASSAGWTSANWSGYAVTAGPYTSVTSAWTVPAVTGNATATYSSTWVGIDGFNNQSLIQAGTSQHWYGGAAHYSAWWEILPAAATPIAQIVVHAGDRMAATIARMPGGATWTITLKNSTTGASFATTQPYGGPGASAEWIHEAPLVGSRTATLAHFSPMTIVATANGRSPEFVVANRGSMFQGGGPVSTPSLPGGIPGSFSLRNAGVPGATTVRAASVTSPAYGIRLTWTPAAANNSAVTSYRVYRLTATGARVLIATVKGALSYTDPTKAKGRTASYQVVAVNSVGAGSPSNTASAISR